MSDRGSLPTEFAARCLFVVLVTVTWIATGCERPFVEAREPEVEVVRPDLSVVQPTRDMLLEIRATSLNGVDSVLMNGVPLLPGVEDGMFSRPITLNAGLTTLLLEAFDASGAHSSDTVYAVVLPTSGEVGGLRLPEPRGGHTATRLQDGRFMIAGGASGPNEAASTAVWIYDGIDLRSHPAERFMTYRRTEHTATLLPDGRVLLLGGAEVTVPTTISEIVEPVELFDPATNEFSVVPVSGDPIRRSGHTSILFQIGPRNSPQLFLYLYGGRGDVQYRPQARMGIRGDLRALQFRNDSLVALGPAIGPSIDAIWEHTSTAIQPQIGDRGEYLIGGSFYVAADLFDEIIFQAELSTSVGFRITSTGPMHLHRSGHAAARNVEGEVLIFGGRAFELNSAFANNEVYYSKARMFFPFPIEAGMLQKRWGHTATNWDADRILIVGGFGETGAALQTSEWFTIDRNE